MSYARGSLGVTCHQSLWLIFAIKASRFEFTQLATFQAYNITTSENCQPKMREFQYHLFHGPNPPYRKQRPQHDYLSYTGSESVYTQVADQTFGRGSPRTWSN